MSQLFGVLQNQIEFSPAEIYYPAYASPLDARTPPPEWSAAAIPRTAHASTSSELTLSDGSFTVANTNWGASSFGYFLPQSTAPSLTDSSSVAGYDSYSDMEERWFSYDSFTASTTPASSDYVAPANGHVAEGTYQALPIHPTLLAASYHQDATLAVGHHPSIPSSLQYPPLPASQDALPPTSQDAPPPSTTQHPSPLTLPNLSPSLPHDTQPSPAQPSAAPPSGRTRGSQMYWLPDAPPPESATLEVAADGAVTYFNPHTAAAPLPPDMTLHLAHWATVDGTKKVRCLYIDPFESSPPSGKARRCKRTLSSRRGWRTHFASHVLGEKAYLERHPAAAHRAVALKDPGVCMVKAWVCELCGYQGKCARDDPRLRHQKSRACKEAQKRREEGKGDYYTGRRGANRSRARNSE